MSTSRARHLRTRRDCSFRRGGRAQPRCRSRRRCLAVGGAARGARATARRSTRGEIGQVLPGWRGGALAEGWKTYWRMPGDAGVPPLFDWAGSTNVATIKVLYPGPAPHAGARRRNHRLQLLGDLSHRGDADRSRQARRPGAHRGIRHLPGNLHPGRGEILARAFPPPARGQPRPRSSAHWSACRARRPAAAPSDPELRRVDGKPRRQPPAPVHRACASRTATAAPTSSSKRRLGFTCRCRNVCRTAPTERLRFEVDLSRGGNARDLKAKTLTLTLVSDGGATEATWTVP